ncbi:DNA mismatch repair endonuclease MutL [uncultured Flavobacterium sp.]|uniref:DNA mismatch repair endonuclease MutL n=1 Tax=uncultured Flavobacterium sp. TaxID=165435 RepID=UPI0030CA3E95
MPSKIQLLPDHVANQIAAGEVVQRPASVVKELIENAVDAKANEIKLIIKEAGKTLIQVIDNGGGMDVIDARMCFDRHATSKIKNAEDLFDLHTKGFRGEALASIAAIAHMELKTRLEDEELGTHIVIEGSKVISQDVVVCPKGTSFSVKNIFYNIPARRNFLKSDTIEFRHIVDEFQRVALAHPSIRFIMYHNGEEYLNLPISNFRQRIVNVFAGKTNEKLVPVSENTDIVNIHGFVSKPEFAKKNRSEQFFFVNDRFIKSGYMHHAIMNAYEGLLKEGTQPSYFLFFDVPKHTIDINIHPTKTEIKFDDEQSIYAILRSSIKHSLGQFNVAPILDFERDANLDTPYAYSKKEPGVPILEFDRGFNPFQNSNEKSKSQVYPKSQNANWESLYVGLTDEFESQNTTFESDEATTSLFDGVDADTVVQNNYQLQKKYIVSPIKSGLLIIDQRKAHQRILYEQFLINMTVSKGLSQQLLFPLSVVMSFQDLSVLRELKVQLEHTGFTFNDFTKETVVFSGIPANIKEGKVPVLLDDLVSDLQQKFPQSSFSQNDGIAKSMANSLAVKTGTYLTQYEIDNMVNALFACKDPKISPFKKPTFITLTVDDLDKRFAL